MTAKLGNREALLQAAIRCLQERGYARTTARDLVRASGTNLGAIGYHFGSKEALLNEALAESVRRWLPRVAEAALASSAQASVNDVAGLLFETVSGNRSLAVAYLEAWAQAERSPELRDQLAGHYREFRAAIGALAAAITPEPGQSELDFDAIASLIIALADGLMVQWLLDPKAVNPSRLAAIAANVTARPGFSDA